MNGEINNSQDIPLLFTKYLEIHQNHDYKTDLVLRKQICVEQRINKRCRCVKSIKISTKIASFVSQILGVIMKTRPENNIVKELISIIQNIQKSNKERNELVSPPIVDPKASVYLNENRIDSGQNEGIEQVGENKTELFPINLVFLLVGLQNSGKTTLVSVLKGQNNPNCRPSLGFRPISLTYKEGITVKLYDLGGGEKIRGIWANYYHDVHGVIYVVDSSCSAEEMQDNISVAKLTLGHKFLQGKPLLVINNKIDKAGSKPVDFMVEKLNLVVSGGDTGTTHILATSLHPVYARNNGKPDPNIDTALEWLIHKAIANVTELNERIAEDSEEVKALKAKKQVRFILT